MHEKCARPGRFWWNRKLRRFAGVFRYLYALLSRRPPHLPLLVFPSLHYISKIGAGGGASGVETDWPFLLTRDAGTYRGVRASRLF